MVARQLEAAGVSQPLQWRTYRAFVLGYVDALADLHACNGGKRPAGPESRAMSASVLRTLCGGSLAEALTGTLLDDLAAPEFRSSCEFALGRRAALDDYDHWSERDMSGIQTFIQAAHAELLQLVVQPDFEPASIKVACKAPIG
ncbi:MAG: hypothetical protein JWQ11_141 [Rhizobacter sp.]|nr:hypothetical protein [Rhizobacter sp.]